MDKKAIWIGTGLTALGIAAEVMSHRVTHQLANIALDRHCPRKMSSTAARRFTGCGENSAFFTVLEQKKRVFQRQPHEIIHIFGNDGTPLTGHWFPCQNPKRVVLAMHGWRSCWSRDFGSVWQFFRKNGCSVLYAEQRGQQNSGGDFIGLGMLERYDCLAWLHKLRTLTSPQLPLYLGGVSMGASTVLMAAGLSLPQNVRGIIADCGFTSAYDIGRHILRDNLHLPFHFSHRTVDRILAKKLQIPPQGASTLEALKKTTLPVLLLHGAKDHFVPLEMSLRNYDACNGPKKLVIFPDADHGMCHFSDPVRYEKAILDFWQRYDPV